LALLPLPAVAGDGSGDCGVMRVVKRLLTLIDTMAVSGVDRNYIGVPKNPWQVAAKGNINHARLSMKSTIDGGSKFIGFTGDYQTNPLLSSGADVFAGVWGGYRGYGIGYSWLLYGGKGSLLTLGATGGCYGVNFRRHNFTPERIRISMQGHTSQAEDVTMEIDEEDLDFPINVKSFILDGYYLFNGRRFSYSAAYDQSAYQLRSAGSFMAGAMYYYSNVKYDTPQNSMLVILMDDVGQLRQWQLSVGCGYAYNYVPVRGVLISGMFMPMLTCLNRMKVYRFNSLLNEMAKSDQIFDEEDLPSKDEMRMWADETRPVTTINSHMVLNFNARLSLTYNLGDLAYLNAYGQLYNFRFSLDQSRGYLTEWFVNAALGVRF